jgi:pilus assembly protein Flp/PilA
MLRDLLPRQDEMAVRRLGRDTRGAVAAAPVAGSESRGEEAMKELLVKFVREDEGQDLIEYALLAGLLTTGVIALIGAIGTKVAGYFTALDALMP